MDTRQITPRALPGLAGGASLYGERPSLVRKPRARPLSLYLNALSIVSVTFWPTLTCSPMNDPVACVFERSHTVPFFA